MDSDSKQEPESTRSPLSRTYRELAPYLGLGIQFVISLVIFILLGYWLDKKLESSPLYILIGVFLGLFSGFFNLFRVVSRMDKKEENKR